jgi:hypothetical protein
VSWSRLLALGLQWTCGLPPANNLTSTSGQQWHAGEGVTVTISIPSSLGPTPIGQPVIAVFDAQGHQDFSATAAPVNQTVASGASMTFNLGIGGTPSGADKTCSVVGNNLNNYNGG